RRDPEHPAADRLGETDAGDRPDAARAEAHQVRQAENDAHQHDRAADDPAEVFQQGDSSAETGSKDTKPTAAGKSSRPGGDFTDLGLLPLPDFGELSRAYSATFSMS